MQQQLQELQESNGLAGAGLCRKQQTVFRLAKQSFQPDARVAPLVHTFGKFRSRGDAQRQGDGRPTFKAGLQHAVDPHVPDAVGQGVERRLNCLIRLAFGKALENLAQVALERVRELVHGFEAAMLKDPFEPAAGIVEAGKEPLHCRDFFRRCGSREVAHAPVEQHHRPLPRAPILLEGRLEFEVGSRFPYAPGLIGKGRADAAPQDANQDVRVVRPQHVAIDRTLGRVADEGRHAILEGVGIEAETLPNRRLGLEFLARNLATIPLGLNVGGRGEEHRNRVDGHRHPQPLSGLWAAHSDTRFALSQCPLPDSNREPAD